MTKLLPAGLVSLKQAIRSLEEALFSGLPDEPRVIERRKQLNMKVTAREDPRKAGVRLWEAIDRGELCLVAIGGRPRKAVSIDPDITNAIPQLRNPEVARLSYLRPSNRHHQDFVAWFGQHLEEVTFAVRELELRRVVSKTMRARRKTRSAAPSRRGRPSLEILVRPVIQKLIDAGKWGATQSVKKLTSLVNRHMHRPRTSAKTRLSVSSTICSTRSGSKFSRVRRKRSR